MSDAVFRFIEASDPVTLYGGDVVGAGDYWIDTSGGANGYAIKRRNEADDAWIKVGINSAGDTMTGALTNQATSSDNYYADRYSADLFGPNLIFRKSRNATLGSHAIVQNGDHLGSVQFSGSDGTNFDLGGYILGSVDGTPGAGTDMPAAIGVYTSPDGTSSPVERLTVHADGTVVVNEPGVSTADVRIKGDTDVNLVFIDASTDRVGIGTGAPSEKLHVAGTALFEGNVTVSEANTNPELIAKATGTGNAQVLVYDTTDGGWALFSLDGTGHIAEMNTAGAFVNTAVAFAKTTLAATFKNSVKSDHATAGIGYAAGAGGTVTQMTDKSTGVTLNKVCGEVTMNGAALAADTTVSFVLTNSAIAAGDRLVLNHVSGGTFGAYTLNARAAAGSATIDVRNITAGSLSEAVVIAFAVIKAVTS